MVQPCGGDRGTVTSNESHQWRLGPPCDERRQRSVHGQVEVDLDAWTIVKASAVRDRRARATVVGGVLVQSPQLFGAVAGAGQHPPMSLG
jgi:hypothetical protein